MINIAVHPNITKYTSGEVLKRLVAFSDNNPVRFLISHKDGKYFPHKGLIHVDLDTADIDLAVSIGGDGTLLSLCRQMAPRNIPVCGINIGNLGFLADIEPSEIETKMSMILQRSYKIEERLMLAAYINRYDKLHYVGAAVNDIVVSKAGVSRMLDLSLRINGQLMTSYKADGLIISTPTGSTAYSLSAGGPIVNPKVRGIILTPICPHSCFVRPMLIDDTEVVGVNIINSQSIISTRDVNLTIDGQESVMIKPHDEIIIRQADFHAKILRFEDKNFYSTFMHKLCI